MTTKRFQMIKGGDETLGMGLADYLWINEDGQVCFKKKTILVGKDEKGGFVPLVQRWAFSEEGHTPDCDIHEGGGPWVCNCGGVPQSLLLVPCFYLPDPTRPQPNYLVLCEVRDTADKCVPTSYRSALRKAMAARGPSAKLVWYGFEQSYQLLDADEAPSPNLAERKFLTSERHLGACFDAGLLIHSAWNPPGGDIWDFKVGYRGFPQDLDPDPPSALVVADHLMVAHYLMEKVGGEKGLIPLWQDLALFVSTAELREPGDPEKTTEFLLTVLAGKGRTLRVVPHPTNGGSQCIEVALTKYMDPYKLALDVLEAVCPLEADSTEEPSKEGQE